MEVYATVHEKFRSRSGCLVLIKPKKHNSIKFTFDRTPFLAKKRSFGVTGIPLVSEEKLTGNIDVSDGAVLFVASLAGFEGTAVLVNRKFPLILVNHSSKDNTVSGPVNVIAAYVSQIEESIAVTFIAQATEDTRFTTDILSSYAATVLGQDTDMPYERISIPEKRVSEDSESDDASDGVDVPKAAPKPSPKPVPKAVVPKAPPKAASETGDSDDDIPDSPGSAPAVLEPLRSSLREPLRERASSESSEDSDSDTDESVEEDAETKTPETKSPETTDAEASALARVRRFLTQ